ncbi:MAG: DUF2339 domain-containing protein [Chitinophagales bacterium]
MDGLLFLAVIFFGGAFLSFFLIWFIHQNQNRFSKQIKDLEKQFKAQQDSLITIVRLQKELLEQSSSSNTGTATNISEGTLPTKEAEQEPQVIIESLKVVEHETVISPDHPPLEEKTPTISLETEPIASLQETNTTPESSTSPTLTLKPDLAQKRLGYKPKPSPEKRPPRFWERNIDWETFIGENLINKIGIVILVLGIAFGVRYAIGESWINEIGRVFIGILAGGGLLGLAHYLRNKYHAFSSVLIGGGLAVLYFTIFIAFHEYQIFSQTAAFVIMIGITAFAVMLSIVYDRSEIAILALFGGLASPFMVSTGSNNYVGLFSYLLVLDIGMLILAYFKKWKWVNIIAFAGTVLIFSGWLISANDEFIYNKTPFPVWNGLLFASLFYIVFFLMNIINNVREQKKFEYFEFGMLLSNNALYYSAGMIMLSTLVEVNYQGIFTVFMAVFNFAFAFSLYKRNNIDRNLVYLLIGLVLTFLSLAAPVQLEGNYITLFWAAEAVLLLWMWQKSGIYLMKVASLMVNCLLIISLFMDWDTYYYLEDTLNLVFNKIFITGIVVCTSLLLQHYFLQTEKQALFVLPLQTRHYQQILIATLIALLYSVGFMELKYQSTWYFENTGAQNALIMIYTYGFAIGTWWFLNRLNVALLNRVAIVSTGVLLFIHWAVYTLQINGYRYDYLLLKTTDQIWGYHYMGFIFVAGLIGILAWKIRTIYTWNSTIGKRSLWGIVILIVALLSIELDHLILLLNGPYEDYTTFYQTLNQTSRVGYSVLWGILSFIIMIWGMKREIKTLRIISLALFGLTLAKLFLYDIQASSEAGRVVTFIALGVILLVVSFMYQRIKRLILEDD